MWFFAAKKPTKAVQTTIRVEPHLLGYKMKARVLKESKIQTQISIRPDEDDINVYSSLEYTPYQDIQRGGLRSLELPRKLRLQFSRFQVNHDTCLWDDDGVNELCIDLKERAKMKAKPGAVTYESKWTQTEKG